MKKVGIIVKQRKQEVVDLIRELISWLQKREKEVLIDKELACLVNLSDGISEEEIPARVDLIIVLGGDGTLLRAARIIGDRNVPLLGVNLGNLGFLTDITREEIYSALNEVFEGRFCLDERMKLVSQVWRNDRLAVEHSALNDIVISKGGVARLFELDTFIDESYLATFRADGLILSTPTGSTGYTLAAGGPIVHPDLPSIIVTPICPHILIGRSIIVPADSTIQVVLKPQEEEDLILTLDGQLSLSLNPSDKIIINKNQTNVCLIRLNRQNYFRTLRTKLGWKELNG
jgi:NAD+ kinase